MKITARNVRGQAVHHMDDTFIVEFGEGYERIAVTGHDGYIEVRATQGPPIRVEPRAANSIWVSVKTP